MKKRSKIMRSVHRAAEDAFHAGVMDEHTMREFDAACYPELKPNAETVAAMEEARAGKGKRVDTIEELLAELNSDDDD